MKHCIFPYKKYTIIYYLTVVSFTLEGRLPKTSSGKAFPSIVVEVNTFFFLFLEKKKKGKYKIQNYHHHNRPVIWVDKIHYRGYSKGGKFKDV